MRFSVPHPIPYQGSKRRLANAILSHVSDAAYSRLVEPFAGSAAVTLAAASQNKFAEFVIADRLEPLVSLWQAVIDDPTKIGAQYESLWLREREKPIEAYYEIRAEFNAEREPAKLLYLLARCVKNAVRFNPAGDFNQSPDKRRTGTRPAAMRSELYAAHQVLVGRCDTACADFLDMFEAARPGDLFYLDPPYQGTSEGRDARYFAGVSRERMVQGLTLLNTKGIPFILSYDGTCGDRIYGERLPSGLASRILLDVGRSSQGTLNGKNDTTVESLYISHKLMAATTDDDVPRSLKEFEHQGTMVFV
ncbi:MAG TPA: DNA adenine methylase [Acidisarcina sp.]